jgi:hypothetical protein
VIAAGAAARVGLVGFQADAFAEHHPEGVQLRVESRYPIQINIDELA